MFWDSSAVVPSLLPESRSEEMTGLLSGDPTPAIWWASPVECQSAIYRWQRGAALSLDFIQQAHERLSLLVRDAHTVAPSEELRRRAGRLVASHPLRAGDALQLAAALVWCEEQPAGETFVCLDDSLRQAARREGFSLLPR